MKKKIVGVEAIQYFIWGNTNIMGLLCQEMHIFKCLQNIYKNSPSLNFFPTHLNNLKQLQDLGCWY